LYQESASNWWNRCEKYFERCYDDNVKSEVFEVDVELKSFLAFWNSVHPTHQPINGLITFKYLITKAFSAKFLKSRLVIALRFHFDDLLNEYQRYIEGGNRIEPQLMADVLIVIYQATMIEDNNTECAFRRKWSHLFQLTLDSIDSLAYLDEMSKHGDKKTRYIPVWKEVMQKWSWLFNQKHQSSQQLSNNVVVID
jgi:hypothetical protein